jgi:hypothetical protein
MAGPKKRLRSMADLGAVLDERISARREELGLRHHTGAATASTLSGATGGGSGGSGRRRSRRACRVAVAGPMAARRAASLFRTQRSGSLAEDTATSGDGAHLAGREALAVASLPGTPDSDAGSTAVLPTPHCGTTAPTGSSWTRGRN